MKLFPFLVLLFAVKFLMAQEKNPEKVIGKISMRDGYNGRVNGNHPLIGHNNFSSDDPEQNNLPANYSGIDANLMKLFYLAKAVPDLNPPVGFDAWYQMNSYHNKSGGMYYGWLRVWMFTYYADLSDPNTIDLSTETGLMVWAYVNDPTVLFGKHEYFTDTLHYSNAKESSHVIISTNDDQTIEIIHKQKPLFRPYTIGEFLTRQKKYYEGILAENKEDLETDQGNLSTASSGSNSSIKELNDNIKGLKDDITDRQEDLKTADSHDKSMIQSIIRNDRQQIETFKKIIVQLKSSQQQQFNNELSLSYQAAVDKDKKFMNEAAQKIQQISNEYAHLTNEQKNQQAYVKAGSLYSDQPTGDQMNFSDQWDEKFIALLPPGDKSGKAVYCYNTGYFDKTRPSDIQLIVMKYDDKGTDPIAKKQWEIIQQVNQDKLEELIAK